MNIEEIADMCGVVLGYTIEEEPKFHQSTYGVFPRDADGVYEVYYWPSNDSAHKTMGYIRHSKPYYRALSVHGNLGHCSTLKEAVEFVHAHYA